MLRLSSSGKVQAAGMPGQLFFNAAFHGFHLLNALRFLSPGPLPAAATFFSFFHSVFIFYIFFSYSSAAVSASLLGVPQGKGASRSRLKASLARLRIPTANTARAIPDGLLSSIKIHFLPLIYSEHPAAAANSHSLSLLPRSLQRSLCISRFSRRSRVLRRRPRSPPLFKHPFHSVLPPQSRSSLGTIHPRD